MLVGFVSSEPQWELHIWNFQSTMVETLVQRRPGPTARPGSRPTGSEWDFHSTSLPPGAAAQAPWCVVTPTTLIGACPPAARGSSTGSCPPPRRRAAARPPARSGHHAAPSPRRLRSWGRKGQDDHPEGEAGGSCRGAGARRRPRAACGEFKRHSQEPPQQGPRLPFPTQRTSARSQQPGTRCTRASSPPPR